MSLVIRTTNVSKGTCNGLKAALNSGDEDALQRLVDPACNRAGRKHVISKPEDQLVKSRLNYAASRGFAFNVDELRSTVGRIASGGRSGYTNKAGLPSTDARRSRRARNRDMTYRASENKTASKIAEDRGA